MPDRAYWASVASSADGARLVAVAATGQIYTAQVSPTARPALSIFRIGSNAVIAWLASFEGFRLQENSNLTSVGWSNTTMTIITTNDENRLIVPMVGYQRFYRLSNQ